MTGNSVLYIGIINQHLRNSVWSAAFLLVAIGSFFGCHVGKPSEKILFDFESDRELDRFHWKCHTLFSLAKENATHGKCSLKLELYPSQYPGLAPMIADNDWSNYKALKFDVYNPKSTPLEITVRIDDRVECSNYGDRYNKVFHINSGINHVIIPFSQLLTSGTNRLMNVKFIYKLLIFMAHPEDETILYVDYIRLE